MTDEFNNVDPNHVAVAVKHFFSLFIESVGADKNDLTALSPADMINWIKEKGKYFLPLSILAEIDEDCCVEAIENIQGLGDNPVGANRLVAMWPYLVMANRTNKHTLLSFQLLMILVWDDHVIYPVSAYAHKDVVNEPLTDAVVAHLMTVHPQGLADNVVKEGLDRLHDSVMDHPLCNGLDTLSLIREGLNEVGKKFTPEEVFQMDAMLKFIEGMFPKIISPEVQRELGVEDNAVFDDSAAVPDKPQSGWDDPEA